MNQQRLQIFLHYDPLTGLFTWRNRDRHWFKTDRAMNAWNARYAGCGTGGRPNGDGYLSVRILDKSYQAHRLAWLYVAGHWPLEQVDHINHNRTDNRFVNLREASHIDNCRNQSIPRSNTSGRVGVTWERKTQRWVAQIRVATRNKNLGRFVHKDDAIAARRAAEIAYGFHPNHGRSA